MARGFGVAGALEPAIIGAVAAAAEAQGYDSFWVNDTPGADSLERLAAVAAVTSRIRLGTGVIPLDRRPAGEIIARVRELALPTERLILGVGSGGRGSGSLARVRDALIAFRGELGAPVVVGALGPQMCQLAGERADGVLLNWMTPDYARAAATLATEAAWSSKPAPLRMTYARVALPEGAKRARTEADRYAAIPQYAAHFERMGVSAVDTVIVGKPDAIQDGLARFEAALDEVVARAITSADSEAQLMALLQAAAPAARHPTP